MKNRTKKVAALALSSLLLVSLSACSSGATKEEMKEGMKENIAYLDYGHNGIAPDKYWQEKKDSERVVKLADCIVEAAYDDLSPSGRDTVASGSHEKLTFDDDDYAVMNRASKDCGWY